MFWQQIWVLILWIGWSCMFPRRFKYLGSVLVTPRWIYLSFRAHNNLTHTFARIYTQKTKSCQRNWHHFCLDIWYVCITSVKVTLWRCGPVPPASVGRILAREEITPYDAVLLTLPADFLGLHSHLECGNSICQGGSRLDDSSDCYRWLREFMDLQPEVFETASHGHMRVLHNSTQQEGLLLLKFDNVNHAWNFARTVQHDSPPMVSPVFRLGVRLVRSDSFYTNLKCWKTTWKCQIEPKSTNFSSKIQNCIFAFK